MRGVVRVGRCGGWRSRGCMFLVSLDRSARRLLVGAEIFGGRVLCRWSSRARIGLGCAGCWIGGVPLDCRGSVQPLREAILLVVVAQWGICRESAAVSNHRIY